MPATTGPEDFFCLDKVAIYVPDFSLRLPKKILEETAEWTIVVNEDGVTLKSLKDSTAAPLEIDFAIKTRADWEKVKSRLNVDLKRYGNEMKTNLAKHAQAGTFVTIAPVEPCWYAMRTIGHAETLELMLLEPEFIEDVIATHTDFTIAMLEIGMREGYQFDAIWFFSDLCYKNDVRKLKKEYGKDIAFFGNINMDILARGITREIEEEVVSKIMAAKEEGGYIFHSDHSVPPTVSFDTYRMVVDLARTHGNY